MGQEILYCCLCQGRLLGADFEKGRAKRIGDAVCCMKCEGEYVASLSSEERQALQPKAKRATTIRVRPVPRAASTTSSPRPKTALWIGLGAAAVVGVAIVVVAVTGSGKAAVAPPPAPVRREAAPIIPRREPPAEHVFARDEMAATGNFRRRKDPRAGACWLSSADVADPRTNTLEVEFRAEAGASYKGWVYAGACCAEKFGFDLQATDLSEVNSQTGQRVDVSPGGTTGLPVKTSVSFAEERHASHVAPRAWHWVALPLPKYEESGLKKVRLLIDRQGFAVAAVVISPVRQSPPDESELVKLKTGEDPFQPLSIEKVATAASDRGMFSNEQEDAARLIFPRWGAQEAFGIPFEVADPRNGAVFNAIVLHGPRGDLSRRMPKSVSLPVGTRARAVHLLSGVSAWGHPTVKDRTVSMIVRVNYVDGKTEDHPLLNGVHFADYIRQVEVPESKLAFILRKQQLRYLSITPSRGEPIQSLEFVKGADETAPVVMAVTVER